MRHQAGVLALVVGLAAPGCVTNPAPSVALGPWGGAHVSMTVTATGARLEYDCAEGTIDEPLRPDRDGKFAAVGLHTPGHGGPIREGELLPAFRARYDGHVDDARMSLLVTLTETGAVVGSFELRRASSGQLVRCL